MKKNKNILSVPIFFIIPWLGYLLSLTKIKSKASAFVYIAFAAFIGYAISYSNSSADSYRYAIAFSQFDKNISFSDIINLYLNGELRDIYRISLFKITSIFSEDPRVLFGIAGFIYGIFCYLNLRIFATKRGNNTDIYTFVLALLFITLCSLVNINGFRFHTGAMLAFYSTYKLLVDDKKIALLGLLLIPLFHYSFALFVPLIIVLKLVMPHTYNARNSKPIVFYIFITTFLISFFLDTNTINLSFLTNSNILPDAAANRIDYVNSEEIVELVDKRAESSLYLTVQSFFNGLISIYVLTVIIYIRKKIENSSGDFTSINKIFSLTLLFYAFAYISISIPSGSRFMDIAHIFLIILLCSFYRIFKTNKIRKLILISIIPFSFKILFINIAVPILILTPRFWYGGFIGVILENLNPILY